MVRVALALLSVALTALALAMDWPDGVVLGGVAATAVAGLMLVRRQSSGALVALLTLPVGLAILLGSALRDVRPIPILPERWRYVDPWSDFDLRLPVASEGRRDKVSPIAWVNLGQYAHIDGGRTINQKRLWLQTMFELHGAGYGIVADKEMPWRLIGWMIELGRECGRDRVHFLVIRFPWQLPIEDQLGAERTEYEPPARLTVDLLRGTAAATVGIRVAALGDGFWGEPESGTWPLKRPPKLVPVRVRFEYRDRATEDIAKLAEWMRADPPDGIAADATVPWKYVVAVLNQFVKLGIRGVHLGPVEKPTALQRQMRQLPYPK